MSPFICIPSNLGSVPSHAVCIHPSTTLSFTSRKKKRFKIEGRSSLSYLYSSPVILLSFTHFAFSSSFSVEKVKQISSLLFRLHNFTQRAAAHVIVYENYMLWKGHERDLAYPRFFINLMKTHTHTNIYIYI